MNISTSKKQLAKIISENGGWPTDAEWAVQCKSGNTVSFFYAMKPEILKGDTAWYGDYLGAEFDIDVEKVLPNWHQTILPRDEYFHLYPAPDADGWIETATGICPVNDNQVVDVKFRDGETDFGHADGWNWSIDGGKDDITSYRLRKPEHAEQECQDGIKPIDTAKPAPSIEQLAADYKAKLAIAQQAQEEADSHSCWAEAALERLYQAGLAIGLDIAIADGEPEDDKQSELVITRWRDLRVGDEIMVMNFDDPESCKVRKNALASGLCVVMKTTPSVYIELKAALPKASCSYWNALGMDKCDFKFIRRP